jgi:curved DNA-binding protein CbpA
VSDLYETLQVHSMAEPEIIEAAYRRLARKYHPDVNRAANAVERMQAINAAYATLSDPVKRAAYDRSRGGRGLLETGSPTSPGHAWAAGPRAADHQSPQPSGGQRAASSSPSSTGPGGGTVRARLPWRMTLPAGLLMLSAPLSFLALAVLAVVFNVVETNFILNHTLYVPLILLTAGIRAGRLHEYPLRLHRWGRFLVACLSAAIAADLWSFLYVAAATLLLRTGTITTTQQEVLLYWFGFAVALTGGYVAGPVGWDWLVKAARRKLRP